jgi:asparagine synthase (glutamine-hydrolysing)
MVAKHLGLHHEVIDAHALESVDRLTDLYDEPLADSSSVGCVTLAQAIGGRFKVLLDGDGADEAFGGYRHYEHIATKQWVKSAAATVGWFDGDGSSIYVEAKAAFRDGERRTLLNGHGANGFTQFLKKDSYLQQQPASTLKSALWSDRHLALANGLNYKMDIALAAYGIEGRAPFLDHRLMEWTQRLPDEALVRGRDKKILLREAYRDRLPAAALDRRKHGFGAPIREWMAGPMNEEVAALLPCPLLEQRPQRRYSGQQQWALLTLARWAKRWRATW